MTGDEERALLVDYLAVCKRLKDGFDRAVQDVGSRLPTQPDMLDKLQPAEENLLLAYLKRFEQFEDALGRAIKTVVQMMMLGKVERQQPRDVANRAEGYGIVASAESWVEAVRTRNALAHEYPLRPDKRCEQVNRAWAARHVLEEAWSGLNRFVDQERLLDAQP